MMIDDDDDNADIYCIDSDQAGCTCGRAEDGGEGDGGGVGGGGGGGGQRGPVQQEPGVPPILHPGGRQRGDDALLSGGID